MDVYSTSFNHPHGLRHHLSSSLSFDLHASDFRFPQPDTSTKSTHFTDPSSDSEAIQKLTMVATSLHGCHASSFMVDQGRRWNFHITGLYQSVMMARGMILKECPLQYRVAIKVARADILDSPRSKPTLKHDVRHRLDEIALQTMSHIAVINGPISMLTRAQQDCIDNSSPWSGLETERCCELIVTGSADAVELARVRLLVMLDELSGLHVEICEVDRKLHAIIAGRKRSVLQSIHEDTATNIYLPSPLQSLVGPQNHIGSASNHQCNVIWITGEFFGVQRARDMLLQLASSKNHSVISRDIAILPRKLDCMILDHGDDIRAILSDNATYVQFPTVGSSTSLITVYGDHRANVQRTIRSIMHLACQYYVASFWLLPIQFNVLLPPTTLNASQVTTLLKQISITTGAEIMFKSMCFEIHGLEHEVRSAVNMILDLDIIKGFHHEIRFQVELANDHRDFISGKKNGKINKIMQASNVKIKFETFNDYNFLIDLTGNDASILQGLTLLQEELPAEVSFHVPEAYHKRIIGIGGRNIQRIMKKYGVYVKFSNAEEFAALGGYHNNEDNVVARTPSKNSSNLENLKQSVMEIVNPKDKDYVNETMTIPRRYHRTLLGDKAIFIHDIEAKTGSLIRFPDKESASDVVTIFGPESQVQITAAMLLEYVPFEAEFSVLPSDDLPLLCASADFAGFVERVKNELQVTIAPTFNVGSTCMGTTTAEYDCTFKFRCQKSNSDFLTAAREMFEQYLLKNNIRIYPPSNTHNHKRGDSFAEAFPHFDSKVLSAARRHESVDVSKSEVFGERRLRLASSSPDMKALFHSPPYMYSFEDREDTHTRITSTPTSDFRQRQPSPIGSKNHPQGNLTSDTMKRGSDSLLESKVKGQLPKPRSLQNRAQSLDLTYSLTRINEATSRLPPDSPTTSTGGTGENSSPNSLTVPLFPSVYVPSIPSTLAGTALQRTIRSREEEGLDEVSRVISKLGL